MRTPSSLWGNLLSSSYLSCTHCKYAVSRNHSSELAQTLFKSSSVPSSESWVDMCNGLLNDVVLAYCCAVCWCGKRECVVRTCWMVWLMMSSETAKTACVDVGGKFWWLKWAVRQGLCAWVRAKRERWKEGERVFWHFSLRSNAVPLTEQPRFKSFPIWKEPPAWKFCKCLLYPHTHHHHHTHTLYYFLYWGFTTSKKESEKTLRWGQRYNSGSPSTSEKQCWGIKISRRETRTEGREKKRENMCVLGF